MWMWITLSVSAISICISIVIIIHLCTRCKHKWEKIVDKEFDSPFKTAGLMKMSQYADDDLLKRTSIIILVCQACGTINKTITRI